ncbi:unnamed protein product [Cunninghamella blakesleeana]
MEVDKEINVYSWVTLSLFLLTIIPVIRPTKIKLNNRKNQTNNDNKKKRTYYFYLNLATVPPFMVLLLLICGATNMTVIKNGLVGSMGIQPYSIMILFYSLAYLCVSLDMTGLFQFLAFWVSKKAGTHGYTAFTLFYVMTSLMSGLTSNDVVILTGTAFLAYFTRVSDLLPTAFMMSEFTSANIASMALFIGNPTNVVVSTAYKISFIEYSAWMILPTIGGLILNYIMLRIVYRKVKYIPKKIPSPDMTIHPRSFLIDQQGAYFGIGLLVLCLMVLIGTSFVHGVEVWMVTLPFCIISLLRDIRFDILQYKQRKQQQQEQASSSKIDNTLPISPPLSPTISSSSIPTMNRLILPVIPHDTVLTTIAEDTNTIHSKKVDDNDNIISSPTSPTSSSSTTTTMDPSSFHEGNITSGKGLEKEPIEEEKKVEDRKKKKNRIIKTLQHYQHIYFSSSVTVSVIQRLPWTVLPFSLGMFVLVEILADVGWIEVFSKLLVVFTFNYVTAVLGMLVITVLLCQFLNNLPTTILLTRIIQHPAFALSIDDRPPIKQGILLGLIAGSNIGANFTLVGSLAGIMFEHILKTKGIFTLGYFQFLKWNLLLLPVVFLGISGILILELYVIYIR